MDHRGEAVVAQPRHQARDLLAAIWPHLPVPHREQAFKPFVFHGGHVHAVEILHLGALDPEPSVRGRAFSYLQAYAYEDFSDDIDAYQAWWERFGGQPLDVILTTNAAEALDRLARSLVADFGVVKPRIAVLALNPHAGDGGLLGREEEETIRPAVNDAYAAGVLAFGPFASDGFFASGNYAHYDAVLAMYHDQGLAPFKTLTPDGVNYTAGLCEVRTSPDHGVAYDIAGRDKADPQSMRNAIYAALDIVENRRRWAAMSADPLQHFERDRGRDASAKDLPEMREGRHD